MVVRTSPIAILRGKGKKSVMRLHETLAPTYVQGLTALGNWLRKAADRLGAADADALLSARLAPDMFPLATQVRFACVQAAEGMHRLHGKDFPALVTELLDEGRNAGEAPGTIAQALTRIDETLAMVAELSDEIHEPEGDRRVTHDLPMGLVFDLTLEQYVRDWALPQFFFHLITAYAIMRGQGVDLGKADYVAHMFAYARPGTLPEGMG